MSSPTQHLKLEPPGPVQHMETSFPSFQHLQEVEESHKPPGPVQHGLESEPGGMRDTKATPAAAPRAREPTKGWGCLGIEKTAFFSVEKTALKTACPEQLSLLLPPPSFWGWQSWVYSSPHHRQACVSGCTGVGGASVPQSNPSLSA